MISTLQVAQNVRATRAEGPHLRYSLWVQGCSLGCPGCCNPEFLSRRGGTEVCVEDLVADIRSARDELGIEGITLVGGEPLDQLESVAIVCRATQGLGLGVLLYTGFTMAKARALPGFSTLWPAIDTIVDGRFERGLVPVGRGRGLVGSSNQRVIHRTRRYSDAALWVAEPAAEVRIDAHGDMTIVGSPDEVAQVRASLR